MTVAGAARTGAPDSGTSVTGASPVTAPVRITRPPLRADDGSLSAATLCLADPDEAFFAGHYPGFPIFPGVCVIECVRRSALLLLPLLPGSRRWSPHGSAARSCRATN